MFCYPFSRGSGGARDHGMSRARSAVAVMAGGRAGLDWAKAHPDLRVLILAPSWRDLDEIRGLIAQAGADDRIDVHHRSAAEAARRAGYRMISASEAA